jgi:hypothetical protein
MGDGALLLPSSHRIERSGMGTGSLWFWATPHPGEEALVGYTFAYDNYLLGRRQ